MDYLWKYAFSFNSNFYRNDGINEYILLFIIHLSLWKSSDSCRSYSSFLFSLYLVYLDENCLVIRGKIEFRELRLQTDRVNCNSATLAFNLYYFSRALYLPQIKIQCFPHFPFYFFFFISIRFRFPIFSTFPILADFCFVRARISRHRERQSRRRKWKLLLNKPHGRKDQRNTIYIAIKLFDCYTLTI